MSARLREGQGESECEGEICEGGEISNLPTTSTRSSASRVLLGHAGILYGRHAPGSHPHAPIIHGDIRRQSTNHLPCTAMFLCDYWSRGGQGKQAGPTIKISVLGSHTVDR